MDTVIVMFSTLTQAVQSLAEVGLPSARQNNVVEGVDNITPIAGNSKTVALGPGGMALAPGLPLGLGWFIRRRLGLDASDILDRKLGLK